MPYDQSLTPDVFRVTSAGGPGLTPGEIRSSRFVSPSRGVRIRADVERFDRALGEAALCVASEVAVLSDVAAARRWNLPLPPWIGLHGDHLDVSVAVPADANRPQRVGVKGRRLLLPRGHLTELDGCPVTTPARTWLDCAPLVPLEHLVAMGDATLRRHLTTAAELAEVTRWAHGRRGVVKARRALPILDGRSESPGESLVRAHLVLGGTEPPECNVDIVVAGEWIARADLAWRRHRLIVEYDGSVHLTDRNRKGDAARRNLLMQAGWRVLTFTSADLAHPWTMVALVRSELRRPIHPSER